MTDVKSILARLQSAPPTRLDELPNERGIYELYDHAGRPCYIGRTASMTLRKRIYCYHVTGDRNSHKFSAAYNAGRMFHERKHPATCSEDGPISKALRNGFVRKYCRAAFFSLPSCTDEEIAELERQLIAVAPPEMKLWNGSKKVEATEPTNLLDEFLNEGSWTPAQLDAFARQAERWRAFTRGS